MFLDEPVFNMSDAINLHPNDVTRFQVARRFEAHAYASWSSGGDDIARKKRDSA
jgi:hypothetical protein